MIKLVINNKNSNQNAENVALNSEDKLFQYIKPTDNDMFSKMSGIDLQELFYYMENYYLDLRNRLGFDSNVTFGLELEMENAKWKQIENKLKEISISATWKLKNTDSIYSTWLLKEDETLYNGLEINTPILKDTNIAWKELQKVCAVVNKYATIGPHSGGHIHVGTQVLGGKTESWMNFIKLWSVYENIIYRFAYGEYLIARPFIRDYADPMARYLWRDYQKLCNYYKLSMKYIINKMAHQKCQAVNFKHAWTWDYDEISKNNTIEFRCPNGTLDPVIWQNNVNFFVNLLLYSKSSRFNDDIVQNRKNINGDKYIGLNWYNEIYLQQALELGDMLFTNNFDKVYFLRQYLKSFETSNEWLAKAKPFTKNLSKAA